MLRKTAMCCICLASFGKCSQIWMPGTLVLIGLNSPASAVPGFMSQVSFWLGAPDIHKRMHDFGRLPATGAAAASRPIQPDIEAPRNPAPSFNDSRRVNISFSRR
jgi:hypothetical protein